MSSKKGKGADAKSKGTKVEPEKKKLEPALAGPPEKKKKGNESFDEFWERIADQRDKVNKSDANYCSL